MVVDANGCQTLCDFTINTNDCVTAVGTMSNDLENLCGEGCLTADYDDLNQFLDADDILQFVLHTGTANVIVGEIARSDQPTFCFDVAALTFGITYYISAVAGNDDGTGQVDLGDDCTQVAFGTPIIFLENPVAAIDSPDPITCDNDVVELLGSSTAAGSIFEWSTNDGTLLGDANNATIQAGSAGGYTLIVEANGCFDTAFVDVVDLSSNLTASITATRTEILDCTIDAINLVGDVVGTLSADYSWSFNNQVISTNSTITVDEGGLIY